MLFYWVVARQRVGYQLLIYVNVWATANKIVNSKSLLQISQTLSLMNLLCEKSMAKQQYLCADM